MITNLRSGVVDLRARLIAGIAATVASSPSPCSRRFAPYDLSK
ncbi:hypothetical protein [Agromyces ramosus]|uniref:Uncharacterized protein n=1 Tax=Agromyces ramosus TaxID=33879 RepID=A0ABU0R5P6_9MICO|nr:hypothetical protein [Agromyces ramosus]MDQ0893406.1 hypothetical protein [Agromyces ramosus]